MIVSDPEITVQLDGQGNCIEIDDGLTGIGSGGLFAYSAAKALIDVPGLTAMDIALKSMKIASELCIYTNNNFTIETLPNKKIT